MMLLTITGHVSRMFLGLPDPDPSLSHKGVVRTEIMLAKLNFNTKFLQKFKFFRLKILYLPVSYKKIIWKKLICILKVTEERSWVRRIRTKMSGVSNTARRYSVFGDDTGFLLAECFSPVFCSTMQHFKVRTSPLVNMRISVICFKSPVFWMRIRSAYFWLPDSTFFLTHKNTSLCVT